MRVERITPSSVEVGVDDDGVGHRIEVDLSGHEGEERREANNRRIGGDPPSAKMARTPLASRVPSSSSGITEPRGHARMLGEDSSSIGQKAYEAHLPTCLVCFGDGDVAENVVDDQRVEGPLAGHVVVDGHRGYTQRSGERPHGEVLEAHLSGKAEGRRDDVVLAQRGRPAATAGGPSRPDPGE